MARISSTGRMVARRRASMDLSAPGGPGSRTLWTQRLLDIYPDLLVWDNVLIGYPIRQQVRHAGIALAILQRLAQVLEDISRAWGPLISAHHPMLRQDRSLR